MTNELVMFILQGILGIAMLFLMFILSGMRTTMQHASDNMGKVADDLKLLNDAVLGQYVTRNDSENKWSVHRTDTDERWKAQRILDHELRSIIQVVMVDVAQLKGVPYSYQRPAPPGVID